MKKFLLLLFIAFSICSANAQKSPCDNPVYRQFDFWVGNWEAFATNGKKAGDSKISIILDSCVVLEEWTSVAPNGGFQYKGKSYNTYNAATNQWQQTWVDNSAGSTAFLHGQFTNGSIIFQSDPFPFSKDTMAIRKLSFFNLSKSKVRQFGEISKDNGQSWTTEYDLEYRKIQ